MKGFLVFLSVLLLVGVALQGCQQDASIPLNSQLVSTQMFDPDDDDAVLAMIVGPQGCNGKIGNFVWADHNCDGYQDCNHGNPPEMGLEGVEIRLYDAVTGELLATTYTDSTGRYKFGRLCNGSYLVEVVAPEGYVLAPANAVPDTMRDSNPNPSLVIISENNLIDRSIDFGFCEHTGGGEGCTPGYWKQDQHFDSWPAPYTPDMLFGDVFEDAFPGMTLVQVAANGGGGLDALGRHTVAALLNGASGGVDYDLTAQEVIDMFNALYPATKDEYETLKDVFENYNEQGCPLN